MRGRTTVLVGIIAAAALAAGTAHAKAPKAGEPFLPPQLPSSPRMLAGLEHYQQVLVALNRGAGGEALVRRAGGTLLSARLALWEVRGAGVSTLIERLREAGALRYVEPDRAISGIRAATGLPAEPFIADQAWWHIAVGADLVDPPGPGVPITILDTGIDPTHPEFVGRPNLTFLNNQVVNGEGESHGTGVASVAAAPVNGVGIAGIYPQANLRIYDGGDFAGATTCADTVVGIEAAIAAGGAGIINGSFGSVDACFAQQESILTAFGTGSIFVAAAGNEFQEGNPLEYPASLNHVLTVAAVDINDQSSFFSNASLAVDLAAPGQGILAAGFDATSWFWEFVDGTSFAAPIVSAGAAWVWTVRPELDQTQIFNLIRYSARDVWDEGYDVDTGFGVLDLPAALNQLPPIRDPQEPNEDVHHVKANGLFSNATPALTTPTKRSNRVIALLDITEDPLDVYRAYIPGKGTLSLKLTPTDDVDLQVYAPGVKTVYGTKGLVATSEKAGTAVDSLVIENQRRGGVYVYVVAYLPVNGPLDAGYRLNFKTRR
jgi:hypothetical protein